MGKKKKRTPKVRNPMAQALHSPIFHKKVRRNKKRVDKKPEEDYALSSDNQKNG